MNAATTLEMYVQQAHFQRGPLRGLFAPAEEQLYVFDDFTVAGQVKPTITIGRVRRCDIQVADPAVSRLHCEIERGPDGMCIIVDVGSRNGLYVNDVRVSRAELWPGMWIFLGSTELIAVGSEQPIPIVARSYTSYLVRAKSVHGTAERAASRIHRSAATIYRALRRWRGRAQ